MSRPAQRQSSSAVEETPGPAKEILAVTIRVAHFVTQYEKESRAVRRSAEPACTPATESLGPWIQAAGMNAKARHRLRKQ